MRGGRRERRGGARQPEERGGRMQLGGNLLTIGEVLEKMMEGNDSDLGVARRAEVSLGCLTSSLRARN